MSNETTREHGKRSEVFFALNGALRNIEIANERIGLILKTKGVEAVRPEVVADLVNEQAAYISKCCMFIATSIASGWKPSSDTAKEAPCA